MLLTQALLLVFGQTQTPANKGYYMQPSIRGNDIVFVSQGDLWRVGITGGTARSLTGHNAPAGSPAISPDGKTVAFTGSYEGPREAYTMPIDGALPTRLTYGGVSGVAGWTPDGKVIVTTRAKATLPDLQLASIDPASRRMSLYPLSQASDGAYDAATKTLFFTRARFQGSNTKRYVGGTAQGIWKYTDGAPEAINLTKDFKGTSKYPMVWKGRVYFLTDRDGTMNLWSMDPNGGGLKQHSHASGWDVQSASIDAGRAVYQLGADLHVLDLNTNEDKTLDVTLQSDFEGTRDRWQKNPMAFMSSFDASPDGKKVALTARGQVFVAPTDEGRFVEVSRKPGVRYRSAIFSPDGKWIYAISDQSGETEWWRMPVNGVGAAEQITTGSKVLNMVGTISPDGKKIAYSNKDQELMLVDVATKAVTKIESDVNDTPRDFVWSPDSRWLCYNRIGDNLFSRLYLYEIASGKSTPITTERADSSSPAWSPDGKWLYFLSDRTFSTAVGSPWGPRQPEPFFDRQTKIYGLSLKKGQMSPFEPPTELTPEPPKPAEGPVKVDIDLDGIENRLWEVPVKAGNYGQLKAGSDRLFAQNRSVAGPSSLVYVEVKSKDLSVETLAPSVDGYDLSDDTKTLVIQKDGSLFAVPASSGGPSALKTPVDLSAWNFAIDPREEWRQMFDEAWRLERDYFWDRGMSGVDWKGMREKYRPLVDRVRDRTELSNILAQMIGELSTLHMFVYGGDNRGPSDAVGFGYLGGEFSRDPAAGGYRIDRIYAGDPDYPETLSPLVRPSTDLSVGDTILSVNGQDVLTVPDLHALLRNQAGKQVLLRVKDGKTGQARDCIVKPIDGGKSNDLQYTDWEVSRRKMVETKGGGQIGYLHLRAMGQEDIETWARDFYPVFNRSGLIIDARHNNGGNIDSWIIEKLLRKAWFYWQARVGAPTWNMQYAFRGHVAVLCDENTASDGEAFSEGIKRLNLGKVIGTRTWGGEIWLSSSNFLGDGGIATAAEFGVYGPEGKWLVEGHGVDPDIEVDNLPHATFMGKDAQLEAALAYLAKEIKDHPIPVPPAPKYPDKSFPPKKGS
ncbi:S41 family peptidase [soil metagenome]